MQHGPCQLKLPWNGKGSNKIGADITAGDGFHHIKLTSKSSVRRCACSSIGNSLSISSIQAGVALALGVCRRRKTWYISCNALRPYLQQLSHRYNVAVKGMSESQERNNSAWQCGAALDA